MERKDFMMQDSNIKKTIKSIAILLGMILIVALLANVHRNNSMTLSDHEALSQDTSSEASEANRTGEASEASKSTAEVR